MKITTILAIVAPLLLGGALIPSAFAQQKEGAPVPNVDLTALYKAGKFAEVQKALEAQLKVETSAADRAKLQNALADVHFWWARQLAKTSDYAGAIAHYQKAYETDKTLRRRNAAADLNEIGFAYWSLSQPAKALAFYNLALPICREFKDRSGEADTLNDIGGAHRRLSQYGKALEFYNLALPIYREVHDRGREADTLNDIGLVYCSLSQYGKALEFYNRALPIQQDIRDRDGEATTLSNIGIAYYRLSQPAKALEFYKQALPIEREVKDRGLEANTLNNIGLAYDDLNQPAKALTFFNRALPIQQDIKDRSSEAATLDNIGEAYWSLSQPAKALEFYNLALPITREVKDRSGEAVTLGNLMWFYKKQKQPELAIVYGKQSVNVYQSIRRDITGLSKESKDAYVKGNKDTYETLARLLIDAGRFTEADEVLAMVQQNEFLEFVRRDTRGCKVEERRAGFDGTEKPVVAEEDARMDKVVALSGEEFTLSGLDKLTPAQTARLAEVRRQLKVATDDLDAFFAAMPARFGRKADDVRTDRNQLSAMQPVLGEMGGGVALVSTFVDDQGLELLLTLPSGPTLHLSYPAKDAGTGGKDFPAWLNTHIKEFNDAIVARAPVEDRATQLNNILSCHGALQHQLEGTGISTLLWRLNGPLRAIPLAALRDKDGYWVEKWCNVVLTAGSSELNLRHQPVANWKALGVGVTHPWTVGGDEFPALGGVRGELRAVVNAPADGFDGGVLPGHILEDAGFTETAFFRSLRGNAPGAPSPWQVIHIASHFKIAGDSLKSFLLMGDGHPLTVAALQERARTNALFPGVELMTLSACQTAQGTDSLGALAEINGADAVLATLWPVADKETAGLMADFYKTHAQTPDKGKAWALQHAQLALLHGGGASAHPYYWAPFMLMGNPR